MRKRLILLALALTLSAGVAQAQTPQGSPSDPAWSGSGAGSMIAILKALYAGGNNTNGVNVAQVGGTTVVAGTCEGFARTFTPINISTATTTRIIAPASAKKTYICGMFLWAGGTNNVGIVEGTGGTCGTGTAGVVGGTTAATGLVMTAQNAFVMTSTGYAQLATAGTNVDFCLITSAAQQLSGHVVWVQAP